MLLPHVSSYQSTQRFQSLAYYEAVTYPRTPLSVSKYSPATPARGALTRAMRESVPLAPIENELSDPCVALPLPRSRQYKTRLEKSRFNQDGLPAHSAVVDVTERLDVLPYSLRDSVLRLPSECAAKSCTALLDVTQSANDNMEPRPNRYILDEYCDFLLRSNDD